MYALHADGNAYLWKARNRFGQVVEIHPLLPDLVEPEGGSRSRVTHYKYTPDGKEIHIPRRDMIHLRIGMDRKNHRRGLAPLKSALREVYGDEQASRFTTALTRNTGVAPVLISPKDEDGPDEEEGERIVEKFNNKVGGDRRGNALFLNGPVNVDKLGFSPKDMDLSSIRRLPEERVAAVLGVPPVLAGLGTGIVNSSGRNETRELIEAFTEGKLVPMWSGIGKLLTKHLLREFTEDVDMTMRFTLKNVRALAGDRQKHWQRVSNAYTAGIITRREAREALDEDYTGTPEDEIYYTDISGSQGSEDLSSAADDGTIDPEGGPRQNGRATVQNA
jgi:HK97 family phage portal protein